MDNNNKKRQRLNTSLKTLDSSSMESIANISGQDTFMLSAGSSLERNIDLEANLPSNLYFTICDDISNDSHEFLAVDTSTTITQIKEPKRESNSSEQPLQYRLISQVPKTPAKNDSSSSTRTTLMPATTTTVQLPSGCEIYLVKEYVESDGGEILFSEDCKEPTVLGHKDLPQNVVFNKNSTHTVMKSATVSIMPRTNIKTEPGTHAQFLGNNVITSKMENSALKTNAASIASNYKKRDEKRRATHNEVERRRRDKINSWIFKLKEMLPTDISSSNVALKAKINNNRNISAMNVSTRLPSAIDDVEKSQLSPQQAQYRTGNSSRSPPNDSKSQILIKACDYIRAMQDEVKCWKMENEKLRSSNLRLQNELQKWKNSERRRLYLEQQRPTCDDSFNQSNICNSPSDGFTLTFCTNGTTQSEDIANPTLFTSSTNANPSTSIALINGRKTTLNVPYTKRELIITDYVD